MEASPTKWWHVADKEVEELVSKLGGDDPFRPTVVAAATRPPRPRVANSPRPPVSSPSPPCISSSSAPRPQVTPGTPLMSFRSHTPLSRPTSARRSSTSLTKDGKITVYVYNIRSSDKLVLRVSPDLRIGSKPSGCRDADSQSRQAPEEANQSSLKDEIAGALGIDVTQTRLMFHGTVLGDDEKTLRCYGIKDGETVHLRVQRGVSAGRDEVVLASAAKRDMEKAEWEKEENLCLHPFSMQPPAAQARISQRCAKRGAALMPKWVSQEHPKLFAPVGIGLDGHGGVCNFEDFNLKSIWTPPVDHPNQRGANQYGLQRVREAAHRSSCGGA